MEDWPTMRIEELTSHAQNFAEDLTGRLEALNERHMALEMSEEEQQRLQKFQEQYGDIWPDPQEMRKSFERAFCLYMGSRYRFVP